MGKGVGFRDFPRPLGKTMRRPGRLIGGSDASRMDVVLTPRRNSFLCLVLCCCSAIKAHFNWGGKAAKNTYGLKGFFLHRGNETRGNHLSTVEVHGGCIIILRRDGLSITEQQIKTLTVPELRTSASSTVPKTAAEVSSLSKSVEAPWVGPSS